MCAAVLEENSQGGTTGFGQKAEARGFGFVREFLGREGEIALIGPAVTVALKAQAFFLLDVFNRSRVLISNAQFPRGAAEGFLTAGERQRTRCARATFPFTCMTRFNLLLKQPDWEKKLKLKGQAEM